MWTYEINSAARDELFDYIRKYKDYFLDTFTDTGLGIAEEVIRKGYELSSKELFFSITKEIDSIMRQEVLAYKIDIDNTRVSTCSVEKRRVYIQYSEDFTRKNRIITGIKIIRK